MVNIVIVNNDICLIIEDQDKQKMNSIDCVLQQNGIWTKGVPLGRNSDTVKEQRFQYVQSISKSNK